MRFICLIGYRRIRKKLKPAVRGTPGTDVFLQFKVADGVGSSFNNQPHRNAAPLFQSLQQVHVIAVCENGWSRKRHFHPPIGPIKTDSFQSQLGTDGIFFLKHFENRCHTCAL